MSDLPFFPFDESLRNVLRQKYLKNASLWLLGKDDMSVLAQGTGSGWEAALTVTSLIDAYEIFQDANEERKLNKTIRVKSVLVAKWLLTKKIKSEDGLFVYWEGVTWDTAVIIIALLTVLKKFGSDLSEDDRNNIIDATKKGSKWLYYRFNQWDQEVKYPFGPADVGRIINGIIFLARNFPEILQEIQQDYKENISSSANEDWVVPIIQYLLHRKTEQTLTVTTDDSSEEVVTYWWDDYFSSSEVVESLSKFYDYCNRDPELYKKNSKLLKEIKQVLVKACAFFEHGQADGMWGSHVDTIKIINSYVQIRRLIPQSKYESTNYSQDLFIPELHTTFKALRWMCDEKQIFTDGSMLHTMFLTVFYIGALVEVYKSWEPAQDKIGKIYDDVVWSSPVRSTPERIERLSAGIQNEELNQKLDMAKTEIKDEKNKLHDFQLRHKKTLFTSFLCIGSLFFYFLVGSLMGVLDLDIMAGAKVGDLITYTGIFLTILVTIIIATWKTELK